MKKRLIEEWLPIAEIGIEGQRERTPMTPFPAPNRLHVWWARRPLVASRAAILASLLPEDADREKFMHVLGIHGDPVGTLKRIKEAKIKGKNLGANIYGYKRAFSYLITNKEKEWIEFEIRQFGHKNPIILDPTSGGGSIPFEAVRLGISTIANDLNPVASLILKQTVEAPIKFSSEVLKIYNRISKKFIELAKPKYKNIFPEEPNQNMVDGYLWARTITCPYCDGLIPLNINWKLTKDGTGVRLIPNKKTRKCEFEIVKTSDEQSPGTVSRGNAKCPFPNCGRVVDGKEVKRQAQAGKMGEQLYAIVYKERTESKTKTGKTREKWVRGYRAPMEEDNNTKEILARLEEKKEEWESNNIIPTETIGPQHPKYRMDRYGVLKWYQAFSPRQLLCHGSSVEVFRELLEEEQKKGLDEAGKAAFVYLSFALDKLLNYNSSMSVWMPTRQVVANTFNRHDFSFCWSFAEMAPLIVGLGYDWAIKQTKKCIVELIELTRPDINIKNRKGYNTEQTELFSDKINSAQVTCSSADALVQIDDGTVDVVVMDPPYYDNVMYAESSDFFYVWLKRTAGYVYPEFFTRQLTDKENEAVANLAKFEGQKGAKDLADQDYRDRMVSIFTECRRVIKDDGIMTLMFNHKATRAWDSLISGVLEAGFKVTASWPINTEAEGSLHIKNKVAAKSTIFLVCRPMQICLDDDVSYWEDVEPKVVRCVRDRIEKFYDAGIRGVDLYSSCYGVALEVLSEHWPLKRCIPRKVIVKKKKFLDELEDSYVVTTDDVFYVVRSEVDAWSLNRGV